MDDPFVLVEIAGRASWIRVICYVIISSTCFMGGFQRPGFQRVSFALAFWFAGALAIPLAIAMGRDDLLWRLRGVLTVAAITLTITMVEAVWRMRWLTRKNGECKRE